MTIKIKYDIDVQLRECVITETEYKFIADGIVYVRGPLDDSDEAERVRAHFAAMHDCDPEELIWSTNDDGEVRSQRIIRKNGGDRLTPVELDAYKRATEPKRKKEKRPLF